MTFRFWGPRARRRLSGGLGVLVVLSLESVAGDSLPVVDSVSRTAVNSGADLGTTKRRA